MTDQERKVMEMALEYLEYLDELDIAGLDHEIQIKALRQALNVDAIDTSSTYVDENEKREHEGCAECGKKASEGWALYCVKCTELFAQPWGTSDMAYRPNGLSVEQEPVAWLTKELMADYLDLIADAISDNNAEFVKHKAYWLRKGDV